MFRYLDTIDEMRQNMIEENKKLDKSYEEIDNQINQKPKIINGNVYALSQHQWRQHPFQRLKEKCDLYSIGLGNHCLFNINGDDTRFND